MNDRVLVIEGRRLPRDQADSGLTLRPLSASSARGRRTTLERAPADLASRRWGEEHEHRLYDAGAGNPPAPDNPERPSQQKLAQSRAAGYRRQAGRVSREARSCPGAWISPRSRRGPASAYPGRLVPTTVPGHSRRLRPSSEQMRWWCEHRRSLVEAHPLMLCPQISSASSTSTASAPRRALCRQRLADHPESTRVRLEA